MTLLTERYADKIRGVLSCLDRVIITGTSREISHAEAMTSDLDSPIYQKLPWKSNPSSSLKSWGYQCMGWFPPMKISIMVVASSPKCIWDVFTKGQAKPGNICLGLAKKTSL
jgi:hypothetical protein